MKPIPGKIYRTRDGHKARVYAIDGGGSRSVHGALWCTPERDKGFKAPQWYMTVWCADGRYYESIFSDLKSGNDLIEEWV